MKSNIIGTFTGKLVNPFAMTVDDICIKDIAHSLAMTCRFRGHVSQYYSVAEHCVRCAEIGLHSPDGYGLARYRLLHDAPEAYLCDVPSPLKGQFPILKCVEEQIFAVMCDKFQIPTMSEEVEIAIKHADLVLLATEARDLCAFDLDRTLPSPLPDEIIPWPWEDAEERYLELAHHLLLCDTEVVNGIEEK
ncbi:hypothetical protein LCGC14_2831880 [marine sediment metagenome]|uniref:HD domain-containing protein n=1 Tax=marine sediment metagenome TaxID=412755 RepID=A0A0F9AM83_9ZZZZ